MDLNFTAEEEAFRHEVRSFLQQSLPERLSAKVREGLRLSRADMAEWHAKATSTTKPRGIEVQGAGLRLEK